MLHNIALASGKAVPSNLGDLPMNSTSKDVINWKLLETEHI